MTNQVTTKSAHVESDDVMVSILAAMAQIERVPAGKTLIDDIPEEDWHDDSADTWNIEVLSNCVGDADEADRFDEVVPAVA